jgi:hypothetical protein
MFDSLAKRIRDALPKLVEVNQKAVQDYLVSSAKLEASFVNLKNSIYNKLFPPFTAWKEQLSSWIEANQGEISSGIVTLFRDLEKGLREIGEVWDSVSPALQWLENLQMKFGATDFVGLLATPPWRWGELYHMYKGGGYNPPVPEGGASGGAQGRAPGENTPRAEKMSFIPGQEADLKEGERDFFRKFIDGLMRAGLNVIEQPTGSGIGGAGTGVIQASYGGGGMGGGGMGGGGMGGGGNVPSGYPPTTSPPGYPPSGTYPPPGTTPPTGRPPGTSPSGTIPGYPTPPSGYPYVGEGPGGAGGPIGPGETPGHFQTVRSNNPGGMYPGDAANLFGTTGTRRIGGGHLIADFPTPVHGAAANMWNLTNKGYVGKTIAKAMEQWSGGYRTMPGPGGRYNPNQVITPEMTRDPNFMIPFMQAVASGEAPGRFPMDPQQWQQAFEWYMRGGPQPPALGRRAPGQAPPVGRPGAPTGLGTVMFDPITSGSFMGGVGGDSASRGRGGHQGVDLGAPVGSLVYATEDGVIVRTGTDNFGQPVAVIQHPDGTYTRDMHLQPGTILPVGTRLRAGQAYARSGSANSVPHLHHEEWLGEPGRGRLIDPMRRHGWRFGRGERGTIGGELSPNSARIDQKLQQETQAGKDGKATVKVDVNAGKENKKELNPNALFKDDEKKQEGTMEEAPASGE